MLFVVTYFVAMFCVVGLFGCAHESTLPPPDPGRAGAPPALSALPRLSAGCSAATQRTHQGLLSARAALQHAMPAPPADRSHENLEAWVGSEVADWLRARQVAVEETRYEFRVSDGPSPAEEVVAHAAIGLIHEDTAESIAHIPPPTELNDEPEIAEMFSEVMSAQANPFLAAALTEFRACVDIAYDGPEDMRHWAYFCQERFARLRDRINEAQGVSSPASVASH